MTPPTLLTQVAEALRGLLNDDLGEGWWETKHGRDTHGLGLTITEAEQHAIDTLALLTPEVLARGERERAVVEAARRLREATAAFKVVSAKDVTERPKSVSQIITMMTEAQGRLVASVDALDADPKGNSPLTQGDRP